MSDKTIGRYEIVEELGRGGMATVYLAYDPTLERDVALKLLPNYFAHDPEFSARFEREAKTVASLEHGAIVSMYDYGEDGEWPYFVMRLMQGGSLKDRIATGPLDPKEATHIIERIAGALDKAHSRGIVHRDLKPGNIMFDEDGEAYLGDFGIVKLAEGSESYTRTGNTLGTPAYMSPEQADGRPDIDGRSDVYALGIILYEMLTGSAPYVHDSMPRLLVMHLTEPIPNILEARDDLPAAMQVVIEKAMAKEPDERFATAGELAAAAQSAVSTGATAEQKKEPTTDEAETSIEVAEEPVPETRTAAAVEIPETKSAPVAAAPTATPTAGLEPEKPIAPRKGIPKWSFGVIAVIVVAIIAAVVVSGGGDETEDASQEGGFDIVNVNDFPICELYAGPTSAEEWELDGISMDPGEALEYSAEAELYDFAAYDCNDDLVFEAYGIEMVAGTTTEILLEADSRESVGVPAEATGEGTLLFINSSNSDICGLYVSSSDADDWGEDYLAGIPLGPDEIVEYPTEPGTYDYFAEDCAGEIVAEEFEVNVGAGSEVAVELP